MTRYRLEIVKHGRRWCDICVEDAAADSIVQDLLARLPSDAGYRASLFREEEARRIVEVTDQARVVGITYSRTAVTISPAGDAAVKEPS